jgi:hypothetical protein
VSKASACPFAQGFKSVDDIRLRSGPGGCGVEAEIEVSAPGNHGVLRRGSVVHSKPARLEVVIHHGKMHPA